jgi:hypothetical protein
MKLLAILLFTWITATSQGQTINVDDTTNHTNSIVYLNSVNGVPFVTSKYARIVEGSIYLPENFSPAQIFVRGNMKPFDNIMARINVPDNQLHYLDEKGREMFSTSAISEIRFKDAATYQIRVYTQSIPGCSISHPGWHEVMEKGKLTLYREIVKNVNENKPYGSATVEQRVSTNYNYWIQTGEACRPVKKISEMTDLILKSDPSFKSKLPQKKLSDKNPEDWMEVVKIYNTTH